MPPLLIAGASIVGGVMAAKGANAQAKAVTDANAQAVAENKRQYEQNRIDARPWTQAGGAAINRLGYLLGLPGQQQQQVPQWDVNGGHGGVAFYGEPAQDLAMGRQRGFYPGHDNARFADAQVLPQQSMTLAGPQQQNADPAFGSLMRNFSLADFQQDPGYQFRLAEGQKALEHSAAARGSSFGGGTLKAIARYGQNMGSQEYQNAFDRFNQNRQMGYNMLAGVAQGGQQVQTNLGNQGAQIAINNGQNTLRAGEVAGAARASGYNGINNAIQGGISNFAQLLLARNQGD